MAFYFSNKTNAGPRVVVCTFEKWEDYQAAIGEGPERAAYLEALFMAIMGVTMPITILIKVRVPESDMTKAAKVQAASMDVRDGVLHVWGKLSHPEVDGHDLTPELLPMMARAGEAREAAKRVAAAHAQGRRYATCHQCGVMFMTEGAVPAVEMCHECIEESKA